MVCGAGGEREQRKRRRKIFGLSRRNRTEKEREKYFEKENIWYREKKRNGEVGKKICLMLRKIRKEREK